MTWTQATNIFNPDVAALEQFSRFRGFLNPTLLESIGIYIPAIARPYAFCSHIYSLVGRINSDGQN
jgi:hypothetical protein